MISLPKKFINKYKKLMAENEFQAFMNALSLKPLAGIRYNQLKINREDFIEKTRIKTERVPWCHTGYYYNVEEHEKRLSVSPYYHAGLYYFQEPSAMLPGEIIEGKEKDRILDLCAAPGGKTTQIAMAMNNRGLLVANEINPKRARALKKNIELYGIKNTIVTNSTGKKLLENYGTYFNKVLIISSLIFSIIFPYKVLSI